MCCAGEGPRGGAHTPPAPDAAANRLVPPHCLWSLAGFACEGGPASCPAVLGGSEGSRIWPWAGSLSLQPETCLDLSPCCTPLSICKHGCAPGAQWGLLPSILVSPEDVPEVPAPTSQMGGWDPGGSRYFGQILLRWEWRGTSLLFRRGDCIELQGGKASKRPPHSFCSTWLPLVMGGSPLTGQLSSLQMQQTGALGVPLRGGCILSAGASGRPLANSALPCVSLPVSAGTLFLSPRLFWGEQQPSAPAVPGGEDLSEWP